MTQLVSSFSENVIGNLLSNAIWLIFVFVYSKITSGRPSRFIARAVATFVLRQTQLTKLVVLVSISVTAADVGYAYDYQSVPWLVLLTFLFLLTRRAQELDTLVDKF